jgi:hypothetical protein
MADPTPGENPTDPVVEPAVADPTPAKTAPVVDPAAPALPKIPAVDPAAPVAALVPEKYELKDVNPAFIAAITPSLKKAGVTAENAQAMATAWADYNKTLPDVVNARDLATLKADPKLGGLNINATLKTVNDILVPYSTVQERASLTALGLSNNPTLVAIFHRMGLATQEPRQTDAGPQARAKLPRETKLYGGGDLVASGKH